MRPGPAGATSLVGVGFDDDDGGIGAIGDDAGDGAGVATCVGAKIASAPENSSARATDAMAAIMAGGAPVICAAGPPVALTAGAGAASIASPPMLDGTSVDATGTSPIVTAARPSSRSSRARISVNAC